MANKDVKRHLCQEENTNRNSEMAKRGGHMSNLKDE